MPVHEMTAGHLSLSGTISCVTDRIRFLPVTLTGRFSNFNSISYTEDRQESQVTTTKCRLPDTMFGTDEIFISGSVVCYLSLVYTCFNFEIAHGTNKVIRLIHGRLSIV